MSILIALAGLCALRQALTVVKLFKKSARPERELYERRLRDGGR